MPYFHHFLAESSTMNNKCCNLAQGNNNGKKGLFFSWCTRGVQFFWYPRLSSRNQTWKTQLLLDRLKNKSSVLSLVVLIYGFLIITFFLFSLLFYWRTLLAILVFMMRTAWPFFPFKLHFLLVECIEISRFPNFLFWPPFFLFLCSLL